MSEFWQGFCWGAFIILFLWWLLSQWRKIKLLGPVEDSSLPAEGMCEICEARPARPGYRNTCGARCDMVKGI